MDRSVPWSCVLQDVAEGPGLSSAQLSSCASPATTRRRRRRWTSRSRSHARPPRSWASPTARASRCTGWVETPTPAKPGLTSSGPGRGFGSDVHFADRTRGHCSACVDCIVVASEQRGSSDCGVRRQRAIGRERTESVEAQRASKRAGSDRNLWLRCRSGIRALAVGCEFKSRPRSWCSWRS